jgi:hypothetical protein
VQARYSSGEQWWGSQATDQPSLTLQLPILDGGEGKILDIITVTTSTDDCIVDSQMIEGTDAARSGTVPSRQAFLAVLMTNPIKDDGRQLANQVKTHAMALETVGLLPTMASCTAGANN